MSYSATMEQLTLAAFADELVKISAVFYRGMGEPYIDDVLSQGLPKGSYLAPDLKLGTSYGQIGADNISTNELRKVRFSPSMKRDVGLLKRIGLESYDAHRMIPGRASPTGGVIKIDLPDSIAKTFGNGLGIPGERISDQIIDPKYISKVTGGIPSSLEVPKSVAARLVPHQMRLLRRIEKSGKGADALRLIHNVGPDSDATAFPKLTRIKDMAKRLKTHRIKRKALTAALKGLL
jgi:hypothetical protein